MNTAQTDDVMTDLRCSLGLQLQLLALPQLVELISCSTFQRAIQMPPSRHTVLAAHSTQFASSTTIPRRHPMPAAVLAASAVTRHCRRPRTRAEDVAAPAGCAASSRVATAAEHLVGCSGDRLATGDYKKLPGRERVGLIGFCVAFAPRSGEGITMPNGQRARMNEQFANHYLHLKRHYTLNNAIYRVNGPKSITPVSPYQVHNKLATSQSTGKHV